VSDPQYVPCACVGGDYHPWIADRLGLTPPRKVDQPNERITKKRGRRRNGKDHW
jgi:hypothetical protein